MLKFFAAILLIIYVFVQLILLALPVGIGLEAGKDLYRYIYYDDEANNELTH